MMPRFILITPLSPSPPLTRATTHWTEARGINFGKGAQEREAIQQERVAPTYPRAAVPRSEREGRDNRRNEPVRYGVRLHWPSC